MKELIFDHTGTPQEVLFLQESPIPTPKPHEVLIRVTARNINPSDIMFIRGMYGITPKLPSSAGFEACGVVERSDEGNKIPMGTRVMFTAIGTWREYICIPASGVIPVPEQMSDEVACQAFVNPMTAYGMLECAALQPGQSLLLTAGASAYGKFVIQMAKERGIHVVATVRHEEQKESLKALGAVLVINTEKEKMSQAVFQQFEEGVDVVFDAVGGALGAKALSCLKRKGKMMVYGALALDNMPINSGVLIFKNLQLEGFWLSSWLEELTPELRKKAFKEVFGFLIKQDVQVDVAGTYSLEDYKKALDAYGQAGRNGKILLVS